MSSVDKRIVEMQFDNQKFENGIKTSTKSLDDLKRGLNLDQSAMSLSNLQKVGNSFSLAGIASGVDSIASKFTTLGIIGVTALQNITNSVINTGKQLISSLTVDPVKMGFQEYETKMNAIQTILTNTASKGTKMSDVTNALNELNTYADQTIYDFSEMTRNIGTFTAAGVDLKTSVSAIKGIANLAAGSGSSAQQASTAMYQLSQALAAGKVQLMDWNSVVNAGMGGELFQKALIKTAKAQKAIQTQMVNGQEKIVSYTKSGQKELLSFRDSLQKGWLTSKVLITTLDQFAKDKSLIQAATQVKTYTQLIDTMKESVQSGWAQTWENIIGNKDEAAKLFTAINDGFSSITGPAADARNATLAFWKANGGRDAIIQALANAFNTLQAILKPIKEAFREVFPPVTGKQLVAMSKAILDLTEKFKIGAQTATNIKLTFKGLFSILDIGVKTFSFIAKAIWLVVQALAPGTGGLLSITSGIGTLFIALDKAITQSNMFGKALGKVGDVISFVKGLILSGVTILSAYAIAIKDAAKKSTFFSDALLVIRDVFAKASKEIKNIYNIIKDTTSKFGSIDLSGTTAFSQKLTSSFNNLSKASDKVKGSFKWVSNAVNKLKPILIKTGTIIKNIFAPALGFLLQKLKELTLSDVGAFLAGGGLLLIGTAFKKAVGSINDVTSGFTDILDGITGSLEAFQTKLKADALLKIGIAVGVLAASIVALSMIDEDALTKALIALTVIFAELAGAIVILDKASLTSVGISGKLIALGVAVLLMALALAKLSTLDNDGLTRGIEGMAAIFTMLALFTKITSGSDIQTSMLGLIGIATSVLILADAVGIFGSMDQSTFDKGIQGVATSLISLALFIKLIGSPENMLSIGMGIMAIGVAMILFAGAVALFGLIPLDNMVKGIAGIAASLMLVVLAMKLMPKDSSIIATGIGLNLMGLALYIIAGAVAIFGSMSLETLAVGIGALAASLMLMAITAKIMTGTLSGAAAMLVMAAAIAILVPSIALLGNLSLASIGIALLAIAGVFVILGVSAALLAPLAPVILTLALSLGVLGLSIMAIGGGLALLATGLAVIAAGGAVFVTAFTAIATAIITLIPSVATKLAEGVISFATAIADGLPELLKAVKTISEGLIQAFDEIVIPVVEAAVKFLIALLEKLAQYIQPMVDAGLDLVIGLLKGISDNIQEFVEVGIDIIVNFLKGVNNKIDDIIDVGVSIVTSCLDGIAKAAPELIDAGFKLIIDFTNGLADTIRERTPELLTAFGNLVGAIIEGISTGLIDGVVTVVKAIIKVGQAIIDGFKDLLGIHSPSTVFNEFGVNTLIGFIDGFKSKLKDCIKAVSDVVTNIISTFTDTVTRFTDSGKTLIGGFITGINGKLTDCTNAITNIITNIISTITGKVTKFTDAAKSIIDGFISGVNGKVSDSTTAISSLVTSVVSAITGTVSKFTDAGKNVITGFIDGIKAKIKEAAEWAGNLAKSALDAAKNVLGIQSPSKEFAAIGKYSAMGFADGLNNFAWLVSREAENAGISAMDSLRGAVANVSSLVSDNMDANPTIRPVLDLSAVASGVGIINSMFGSERGITVSTSNGKASLISRGMQPVITPPQNGSGSHKIGDGTIGSTTPSPPLLLQLVLQNGKAIAEFIVDDLDGLMGNRNRIVGRSVGL